MAATEQRLHGADFIRASACLIVLLHHLAQRADYRSTLGSNPFIQVFNTVGGFGVGMFFVLSGFLLARPFWLAFDAGQPMPSLRTYALRRAARIVPGFWLALTVSFILSITVFGFAIDGWLGLRYASGLLLLSDWHWTTLFPVEVNGPLWSIGFEVTSYAMLPLGFIALFGLQGRASRRSARLLWLAVIAVAIAAHWIFTNTVQVDALRKGWEFGLQGGAKVWMPWFNPFGFFAMFATGALGAGIGTMLIRQRTMLCDLVAALALVGIASIIWISGINGGGEYYGLLGVPYRFPAFQLLVALALATLPSSRLLGRLLDNPLVRYLARISFGLYVWHYVVLELVRLYWVPEMSQGGMADPVKFIVACVVVTAISMVIASLSWRWLEEPVIRWARRLEHPVTRKPALPA